MDLQAKLKEGFALYQQGKLAESERVYAQILQQQPKNFDALHFLGLIALQTNQTQRGVNLIGEAIAINAGFAPAHCNLGNGFLALKRPEEALASYDRAIALKPDLVVAYSNRGNALVDLKRPEEALASCDRAIMLQPGYAKAHNNRGNALMALNRPEEALASYGNAIALQPGYAEAYSSRGNALAELKRPEEALASHDKAIALKPDLAEAYNNRGNVLMALNRPEEALASYDNAIALQTGYAEAYSSRGNALAELKRPEEALASYDKAIALKPDLAEAHYNLGVALKDQGRLDEAVACYRKALAVEPDYVDAFNNLGHTLQVLGSPEAAAASYQRALALKPDYAEVLNNLAGLLVAQGEPMKAWNLVRRSLQLKETPGAKHIFVDCIKHLRFTQADDDVRTTMIRALSEPWGRPNELAAAGARLAKLSPDVGEGVARATTTWPRRLPAQDLFGPSGLVRISADPLLRCLLESAPICDMALERFLTMARRAMLDAATGARTHGAGEPSVLDFHCALARQCFINEYVFDLTDDETSRARSLRDDLAAALKAGTSIPVLWPVAVAAYFPLHSLPLASRLLDKPWPDAVGAVLTQQIREPDEERQYRDAIPRLTTIEDDVSLLVQRQYEENPYPRWIKAAPADKPTTIEEFLRQRFPSVPFRALNKRGPIDILIAGCGTGQHSIGTAQRFPNARVLAVDLSLTSLCYAKRKTLALGLNTIEYAQADILKLGSLHRGFDVIESVGVLHHLDQPMTGWRVLLSLLRPGGFMRIGFYSETSRQDIVRAREFIAKRGYGRTAKEIRRGRQELMNESGNAGFENALRSINFFTISECRDLIFHVQEHRMSLPGVEAFLEENRLQFLGFDLESWVVEKYRARFPEDKAMNDLKLWHVFETENPDSFAAMYQFWIQKPC